jgi:hypothetical protein
MSKKKISEERTIAEKNGQMIEIVWERYVDNNDGPIDENEKGIKDEKVKNKVSILNNKSSKISKIRHK